MSQVEYLNGKTGNSIALVPDPDPVVTVTDDTFAAIVHDPTKHVLV